MTQQIDVHIRPVIHPAQVADGNQNYDHRPQRRESDAPGNPYPWKPGHSIGIIGLVALVIFGGGLIALAMSDFCMTSGCEIRLAKKLELMAKQTDAEINRADNLLEVERARIAANQAIEQDRSIERRAIANSSANARAGMGNNDDVTKQTAVKPDRIAPQPATIVVPPPTPVAAPAPYYGARPAVFGGGHDSGRYYYNSRGGHHGGDHRSRHRVYRGTEREYVGTERVYRGTETTLRCSYAVNRRTGERVVLAGSC